VGAGAALGTAATGLDLALGRGPASAGAPPQYRSAPDLDPPPVTTVVPAAGTAPGLIFAGPIAGHSQYGPMIVDDRGHLVWFRPLSSGRATNVQVQQYRGQPVLAWWQGEVLLPGGYGKGECVLADSSYREVTRIRCGNGLQADLHELFLTPEGTALVTAYRVEEADLRPVSGPAKGKLLNSLLQEIDIATGKVLFEWNARDHVALDESYLPATSAKGPFDFFHINSIDVDVDGALLVSGRHTWTVYKVERPSGAIRWRLNGKLSDFDVDSNAQFAFQHHVRHHPGPTLSIFDDGGGPPNVDTRSRGIIVALDMAAMKVSLAHQYLPDPEFLATSQGSVQVLPDGHVFVGWGQQPYWSEYAPDGRMLFDAQMPKGGDSYRAFRYPWAGQPTDRPSIAAERRAGRRVAVYASWNGATEVDRWQFLAGGEHGTMRPVATVSYDDFEATVTVATTATHVAARALDAGGRPLGESERARVA